MFDLAAPGLDPPGAILSVVDIRLELLYNFHSFWAMLSCTRHAEEHDARVFTPSSNIFRLMRPRRLAR